MIFVIPEVLTPEEFKLITEKLATADFVDGKITAGWHAKLVKNNTQLQRNTETAQTLEVVVQNALQRNILVQSALLPRVIHSILFSCYQPGMSYGRHVDNALMGDRKFLRADISFTLYLSSPDSYAGGELIIESADDERSYKLEAGSMIVYPASTLHRVEPVTEGCRLAAVGWVQSLVRDGAEREILFDLDTSRRSIFAQGGKTLEFDLLSKCYANLLRKWTE